MAITFVAKGVFASGVGALTVAQPAGIVAGDLLLLMVESANEVIATPTGYTQVTNSPQFTGTAALAGGVRLAVFFKVAAATEAAVAVADSGDHTTAIIAAYRGATLTSPIHATTGSVQAAATTAMVFPGVTTTVNECRVVMVVAKDLDAASTATMSSVLTCAGLTGIVTRHDQTIAGGAGGGLVFADGLDAVAGATGNATATCTTASVHAYLTVALRPINMLAARLQQGETIGAQVFSGTSNGASGASGFVAGNSTSLSISRDGGINWVPSNTPALAGNSLTSLAFGAGRYVAMAAGQLAFYSADGMTWTSATAPAGGLFGNKVSFVNGLFISRNDGSGANVFTSPDGITWTTRALAASRAWGEPQFVLGLFVMNAGAGFITTSPDGLTWTQRLLPAGTSWSSELCASASVALVPGSLNDSVARSTDLINWTVQTSTPVLATQTWQRIVFASGRFVRFTNQDGLSLSRDGIAWVAGLVSGVSSTAGYVQVGSSFAVVSASVMFLSADFVNWSAAGAMTNIDPMLVDRNRVLGFTTSAASVSAYSLPASFATASGTITSPVAVFLQASTNGLATTSATLTSVVPNIAGDAFGVSAAAASLSTQILLAASVVVNVLAVYSGLAPSASWQSFIFAENRFLALQYNNSSVAASSPDGITWTPYDIGIAGDWRSLVYANGIYVAVEYNSNRVIRSTNGVTWTLGTLPITSYWTKVVYGAGLFVASALTQSLATTISYCATSPDGTTWTQRTLPIADSWPALAYGNGLFAMLPGYGTIPLTSPDGITWTQGASLGVGKWNSVFYLGGVFLASAPGNNTGRRSLDGLTWEVDIEPNSLMAYGDGVLIRMLAGVNSCDISYDLGLTYTRTNFPERTATFWANVAFGKGYFVGISNSASSPNASIVIYPEPRAIGRLTTQIFAAATALAQSTASALLAGPAQFNAIAAAQFVVTGADLATSIRVFTSAIGNAAAGAALTTVIRVGAASAATASTSGGLTTVIRLSTTSLAQAGAGPALLTTSVRPVASVSALATSSAALTVGVLLSSASSATAAGTSSLTTQILLAGTGNGSATTSLNAAGGSAQFSSTAAGISAASAGLTASIRLNSATASVSASSADLTAVIRLNSTAAGISAASADLTASIQLNSAATGVSTASASLVAQIRLAVSPQASAFASANISTQVLLNSAASANAFASANISTQVLLNSAAAASASGVANLTGIAANFTALASASASGSANISTQILLASSASAAQASAGALTARITMATAAAVSASASASLGTQVLLAASAGAAQASAGVLTTRIVVAASASAITTSAGGLVTQIALAGAPGAIALTGANLTSRTDVIQARADAVALASGSLTVSVRYVVFIVADEARSLIVPARLTTVVGGEVRTLTIPPRLASHNVANEVRATIVPAR